MQLKAEEKWRARGWCCSLVDSNVNEYALGGMTWADNWMFSDNREKLICMADVELERDLRGFRAIALLSVSSKWHATVLVGGHAAREKGAV